MITANQARLLTNRSIAVLRQISTDIEIRAQTGYSDLHLENVSDDMRREIREFFTNQGFTVTGSVAAMTLTIRW